MLQIMTTASQDHTLAPPVPGAFFNGENSSTCDLLHGKRSLAGKRQKTNSSSFTPFGFVSLIDAPSKKDTCGTFLHALWNTSFFWRLLHPERKPICMWPWPEHVAHLLSSPRFILHPRSKVQGPCSPFSLLFFLRSQTHSHSINSSLVSASPSHSFLCD